MPVTKMRMQSVGNLDARDTQSMSRRKVADRNSAHYSDGSGERVKPQLETLAPLWSGQPNDDSSRCVPLDSCGIAYGAVGNQSSWAGFHRRDREPTSATGSRSRSERVGPEGPQQKPGQANALIELANAKRSSIAGELDWRRLDHQRCAEESLRPFLRGDSLSCWSLSRGTRERLPGNDRSTVPQIHKVINGRDGNAPCETTS